MIVSEFLSNLKSQNDYINNSLILKSSDNFGCTYKYLILSGDDAIAIRKEIFIELDETESELNLLEKTIVNYIEVNPAK
jgi:hypothetical protein